jgi:hypothetical protein
MDTKQISFRCARCKQRWIVRCEVREIARMRLAVTEPAIAAHVQTCTKPRPAWMSDRDAGHRISWGAVKGRLKPEVVCGGICTGAKGPSCDCSCAGACHGAGECEPDRHLGSIA